MEDVDYWLIASIHTTSLKVRVESSLSCKEYLLTKPSL